MGTTTEKLAFLVQTKAQIKQALNAKGAQIADGDAFSGYAQKISDIPDLAKNYLDKTAVSLSIPENITNIPRYAFADMPELQEINGTDGLSETSVVKIGDYAFLNCPKLNLALPDTVEELGAYAFSGSDGFNCALSWTRLPSSLKRIWNGVFSNGFASFISDLCGPDNKLILPSGLISIGSSAFYLYSGDYWSSGNSIYIPSSVVSIGPSAFSGTFGNYATEHIYINKASGTISGAPWGAVNATIHWNTNWET